jgi:toxic protein SymE
MRTHKEKKRTIRRPDVRSLKIQPDLKRNRWSQTTVPVIRLSGLWLDRLGFTPERRVIVTTMNKLLIIRLDEQ